MLAQTLNYRPVTVFSLMAVLHSLAYGLGYAFSAGGFPTTILFAEIQSLMPAVAFGALLTMVSIASAWALLKEHVRGVEVTSFAQAIIWLFVFLVYVLADATLLGIGVGLTFASFFAYLAYIYKELDDVASRRIIRKVNGRDT